MYRNLAGRESYLFVVKHSALNSFTTYSDKILDIYIKEKQKAKERTKERDKKI